MRLRLYPDRDEFKQLAKQGNLVPVCLDILADTETPLSALSKIGRNGDPVFLLESVEGGERWGRYSFMGRSARASIKITADKILFQNGGKAQTFEHGGDPFSFIKSYMSGYRAVSVAGLPRFWGGLVGYISYEAVSFFEKIPNHCPIDTVLAHFILPDQLFIFDNVRHSLTLVAYAEIDGQSNLDLLYEQSLSCLAEMESCLSENVQSVASAGTSACHRLAPKFSQEDFRSQVSRTKEYIAAGDVIQTVISQPFVCDNPPDPWYLYRVQRYINPSPYLYFLNFGDMVLVGSSPEAMVRLENGTATLRPIAGTRPRGKTEQEDRMLADELLQDPKERAEHLMLVDLGRNDLGRVAEIGSVQVTDLMVVERYSHVMHLVSNITCDLRSGYDAWDLLRATFPAGTLTGAPKIRAMEIIAELEREPRGPYGGAIGYISFTGNMDMAITIRTACIQNGHLTVQAGAGIVADSDPERERQETENKAMAIQRALRMLETGG